MATLIIDTVLVYLYAGVAVAVPFVLWGIGHALPSARGAWAFRPLIVPGVVVLWPLVLWRWWALTRGADTASRYRPPLRGQARLALVLGLVLPLILAVGMVLRQDGPREREAVQLARPAETHP